MVKRSRRNSMRPFYIALVAIVVVGVAAVGYQATRGKARPSVTDVAATPAQAAGYLIGNPNAPVQVLEFADFECPACGEWATIVEPDVRQRILDSGKANLRYFDFPLDMHQNTIPASNAAACAADQGKFWQMHDSLFHGQYEWNTEATSNPGKVFARYARALGLDMDRWQKCFDDRAHMTTIMGNQAEGLRRGIHQTPTFVIGTKMVAGMIPYDEFVALVDSAAAQAPQTAPAAADSAGKAGTAAGRS